MLFIVLDDTGFGQLGCYGSPIETPQYRCAGANGLLLQQHAHDRAVLAEPLVHPHRPQPSFERACPASPKARPAIPGSNGIIPFENGFLSEILLEHGYNTYALGKWHLTPADQTTAAGPYDRWPLGRGFERYYGFLGGDTHQYYPELVYDNHQVEPPKTPEEGYHLTADLVDKASAVHRRLQAGRARTSRSSCISAPGAMHAPHHVPKEWADKYKGKFDDGWDAYREKVFATQKELGIVPAGRRALAPRPRRAGLEHALRRRAASSMRRMMEVFAGFLEHTDHQHRPAARLPRKHRRARQHADHGHLRQRRQRRGRPDTARSTRISSSTTSPNRSKTT